LAQDLRIWVTPEFALFDLADAHAGGSSGLPHAKVPFGLQQVVGAGVMASTRLAGEMAASCAGPSEGSEPIYSSANLYQMALDIVANTAFMADVIAKGTFRTDEMKRKALLDYAIARPAGGHRQPAGRRRQCRRRICREVAGRRLHAADVHQFATHHQSRAGGLLVSFIIGNVLLVIWHVPFIGCGCGSFRSRSSSCSRPSWCSCASASTASGNHPAMC
jgi:hypothetical protein